MVAGAQRSSLRPPTGSPGSGRGPDPSRARERLGRPDRLRPRCEAAPRRAPEPGRPRPVAPARTGDPQPVAPGAQGARLPVVATFHASAERSLGYAAARPFLARFVERIDVRIAVSAAARSLIARYFPGDYDVIPTGCPSPGSAASLPDPDLQHLKPYVCSSAGPRPRRASARWLTRWRCCAATSSPARHTSAPVQHPTGWCRSGGWRRPPARRLRGGGRLLRPVARRGVVRDRARGGDGRRHPVVCSDLPGYREAAGDAARFVRPGTRQASPRRSGRCWQGPPRPPASSGRGRTVRPTWTGGCSRRRCSPGTSAPRRAGPAGDRRSWPGSALLLGQPPGLVGGVLGGDEPDGSRLGAGHDRLRRRPVPPVAHA